MKLILAAIFLFCATANAALTPAGSGAATTGAWTDYTPTLTGFGTASSVSFRYRQVGGAYDIQGCFVSGTPTATEARISLPGAATVAAITSIRNVGTWTQDTNIAGNGHVLAEPSVAYITLGYETGSSAGLTKVNGDGIITNGVKMCVHVQGLAITGL